MAVLQSEAFSTVSSNFIWATKLSAKFTINLNWKVKSGQQSIRFLAAALLFHTVVNCKTLSLSTAFSLRNRQGFYLWF